MTIYYKWLRADGRSPYRNYAWPLPTEDGQPGAWVTAEGPLELCENGVHLCRRQDVLDHINEALYEVEVAPDEEPLIGDNKVAVRSARLTRRVDAWNDRTARLFAADCAERVLPLFEARYPDDSRPRDAITAARRYATGEITADDLAEAAREAEAAAAASRAEAAAAAARASVASVVASVASVAAAEAAAAASRAEAAAAAARASVAWEASVASVAAARQAEREWQLTRFWQYAEGETATEEARR